MKSKADNLVVIDVETSGPNPFVHDVLSIAIVPVNSQIEPLSLFVCCENTTWTEFSRSVFAKFREDWESNGVTPGVACDTIEDYLANTFSRKPVTPVGHNIGFDVAFLRKLAFLGGRSQLRWVSHRALDTHTMLYVLYLKGELPFDALKSDGAFSHFGVEIPTELRHTALGDALATRELLLRLLNELEVSMPRCVEYSTIQTA